MKKYDALFGVVKKDDNRLNFIFPCVNLSIKNIWDNVTPEEYEYSLRTNPRVNLHGMYSFANFYGTKLSYHIDDSRREDETEISSCIVSEICFDNYEDIKIISNFVGDFGNIEIHLLSITIPYIGDVDEIIKDVSSEITLGTICSNMLIGKITGEENCLFKIFKDDKLSTPEEFFESAKEILLPGESLDIYDIDDIDIITKYMTLPSESNRYEIISSVFEDYINNCITTPMDYEASLKKYMRFKTRYLFNDLGPIAAMKEFINLKNMKSNTPGLKMFMDIVKEEDKYGKGHF